MTKSLPQNEELHGHDYYEYFRSFYEGNEEELDVQLNRQLTFFDEVCKVPVLLSLFVVAVGGSGEVAGGEAPGGAKRP